MTFITTVNLITTHSMSHARRSRGGRLARRPTPLQTTSRNNTSKPAQCIKFGCSIRTIAMARRGPLYPMHVRSALF